MTILWNQESHKSHKAQKWQKVRCEAASGRPVGVNIAKTHDPNILGAAAVEDFAQSFRLLAPLADFVVLNVSCPNTTEGKTFEEMQGMKGMQERLMCACAWELVGGMVVVSIVLKSEIGNEVVDEKTRWTKLM